MNWTSGGSVHPYSLIFGLRSRGSCMSIRERKVKGGQKDTDRIFLAEGELKTVDLVLVQRVVVEDADVHLPFFEVVGFGEGNSRGEVTLHLRRRR